MKYKIFDVVELNSGNKATILACNQNKYNVEIVDDNGVRKEIKLIEEKDIRKPIILK